jgi:hypothetical protein
MALADVALLKVYDDVCNDVLLFKPMDFILLLLAKTFLFSFNIFLFL